MVYGGGRSSGGGRYDGGGYGSSSGYRRDSGPRRSAGNSFGAIDLPDRPSMSGRSLSSGRSPYGGGSGGPSVSPWASGESPSRSSWGGVGGGGGFGSMGGGGAQSNDTLNMAANLVASILQNQQQRRPEPFGASRPQPLYSGGGGDSYGSRGPSNYRGSRTGYGNRSEFSSRTDYGSKFDRRDSYPSSRGRSSTRGRSSRGTYNSSSRTPARRADNKNDKSAAKKKPEPKKTAAKTSQQAIDEAKAAALEKQMESEDKEAGKSGEDAEGQELLVKDEVKGDDEETKEEAGETADAEKKEGETTESADKDKEKEEKKTPAKPVREKIDSKYLNCSVCAVSNMSNEQVFSDHIRGRKHHSMMQMMEQRLEQTAKLIRIEVQVASKRAEMERQRRGKANQRDQGYCHMCNVRVYEDLNDHRSHDAMHNKLKAFLHPRCCGHKFDTPVMHERHLLTFSHLRKRMQKDKELQEAGTDVVVVEPWPKPDAKVNGQAATEAKEGETPAAEGEAAEKPEGEATGQAEGEAMETDAAGAAAAEEKPAEEDKPEESVPVMYDPDIAVATRTGQPFSGTFCTLCKLAMPNDSWTEHCRSRMHYNRALRAEQHAKRLAEAEAARRARAAKKEEEAAALNAEDEEVTVVDIADGDDEVTAETEEGDEQRGTKRPAEDDDDAGDAKIAATEEATEEEPAEEEAEATEAETEVKPESEEPEEEAAAEEEEPEPVKEEPVVKQSPKASPGGRGRGGRARGSFARRSRGMGRGGRR